MGVLLVWDKAELTKIELKRGDCLEASRVANASLVYQFYLFLQF